MRRPKRVAAYLDEPGARVQGFRHDGVFLRAPPPLGWLQHPLDHHLCEGAGGAGPGRSGMMATMVPRSTFWLNRF